MMKNIEIFCKVCGFNSKLHCDNDVNPNALEC
jgi:hypothetical protein